MLIKIGKDERCMGPSPGGPGRELPAVFSPPELCGKGLTLPATVCNNTCGVLPAREAHWTAGVSHTGTQCLCG